MTEPDTEKLTPGQPIVPPENFPVTWEHTDDASLSWSPDSHVTSPMAPLSCSVSHAVLRGFNPAFSACGIPIKFRIAYINGFPYAAVLTTDAPPEALLKTMGRVNQFAPGLVRLLMGRMSAGMSKQQLAILDPILERLEEYWQDDLLPEINQHFAYFDSCDLRGLSQAQLKAHFSECLKRAEKLGELHARAAFPSITAMSMFEDLFLELFPEASHLDALRLLQGSDNQTLAGDRRLMELSRIAISMPDVHEALSDLPAIEVIPCLGRSAEGRHFLADLHDYLQQYGQRLNAFGQLTESSWIEEPRTVVECLKAYVIQPEANPEAERARLAEEREKKVAEARERLAGYPQPVVARFETLLKAAQAGAGIKEDNHWVIERLFYQMRRLALELGRRLAEAGTLGSVDEVFYLSADELLADGKGSEMHPAQRVQQRKAEREYFSLITPPAMLGTMPRFIPDGSSPLFRAIKKSDGAKQPDGGGDERGLRGLPGSAGTACGPARVIRSLAEAGKLQPGDVLVAPATMPPWTPLFGIAAAVVTDTGGVLSHCAVVAREYRIPAVVGTGRATKFFQDGQILEVDGDSGVVRVVATADN